MKVEAVEREEEAARFLVLDVVERVANTECEATSLTSSSCSVRASSSVPKSVLAEEWRRTRRWMKATQVSERERESMYVRARERRRRSKTDRRTDKDVAAGMASGQSCEPDSVRRVVYNAGRALFGTSMAADTLRSRWRTESSGPRMRANVKAGETRAANLLFVDCQTSRRRDPRLFAREREID